MTKDEVIAKYGSYPLGFKSYYKYSFAFQSEGEPGLDIYATIGGAAEDIYKLEVTPDTAIYLCDSFDDCSYISIKENGVEVFQTDRW